MCAQVSSVVPATQNTVAREQLLRSLDACQPQTIVVAAPSGYGKTVLAAQLSGKYESVCWFSCFGDRPDIVDAAVELRKQALSSSGDSEQELETPTSLAELASLLTTPGTVSLVVFDDADLTDAERLWQFGQLLNQAGITLIVTTRSVSGVDAGGSVCRVVVGADELELTHGESIEIAQRVAGLDLADELIEELRTETAGHVALFTTLSFTVRRDGQGPAGSRRLSALLAQLAKGQLSEEEYRALCIAAVLKTGRPNDIAEFVPGDPSALLEQCARVIPLFQVRDVNEAKRWGRRIDFVAHDLLFDYVCEVLPLEPFGRELAEFAAPILAKRGDYERATAMIRLASEQAVQAFLLSFGFDSLKAGGADAVAGLVEGLPLQRVMSAPELLLLWSDALLDLDDFEDAYSKAKAARVLAEHRGAPDVAAHATTNALDALGMANRWTEAEELLSEAQVLLDAMQPSPARMTLAGASAHMLVLSGQYQRASEVLLEASVVDGAQGSTRDASGVRSVHAMLALLPCFRLGDFRSTVRELAKVSAWDVGRLAQQVDVRGNLANALLELGRTARARGLVRSVMSDVGAGSIGYFLSALANLQFATGEEEAGLETAAKGVLCAFEAGDKAVAAQNRVYESMLLRAAGRLDDALTSAERAYETLCVQDTLDFRRLAVLEIAASMLALGDVVAATAWLEPQLKEGFGENEHHRYRALMIQAEIARRQGDVSAAVEVLGSGSEHLLSENSNFQAAMYARAFPHLLGLIAASVGSAEVPTHLLKLIPAEVGEGILQASKEILDSGEWEVLGQRLLGGQQFTEYVARQGSPLCRVRLFGGLEVTVGDRRVREKDWRKRKARLLFAILVLERGRQVSREQLLAHVWPDLAEDKAKNNFYVAWSNMKSALSAGPGQPFLYAENTGGLCSIVRDAVRSDVDEFEECVIAGRDCEASGDTAGAIAAYQQMATVYRGELLPGDLYDDWFMPMRERYRSDFIAVMLRLVELLMDVDDPCEAAVYARRALGVDPYREDLYQALIRCQIAAGQRSAAIETFIVCKTQIAEQLGLDPSPETAALYQEILCMEDKPRYDDLGLNGDRY